MVGFVGVAEASSRAQMCDHARQSLLRGGNDMQNFNICSQRLDRLI